MKVPFPFVLMLAGIGLAAGRAGAAPIYENNFESAAVDKAPEGAMAIAGDFTVRQDGGNKVLELPG